MSGSSVAPEILAAMTPEGRSLVRRALKDSPLTITVTSGGQAMTDEWRAAGVNPPTPRRSITMPATQPYKAVAAFVLTFLGTLLASLQGRKEFGELTALEWLIVVGSALVTTGVVYGISNPPTGRRRPEVGESWVGIAVGIAAVAVIVWVVVALAVR